LAASLAEFNAKLEAQAVAMLEATQKKSELLAQQISSHLIVQIHTTLETVKATMASNLHDQATQALGAMDNIERLLGKQLGRFCELLGDHLATIRVELALLAGALMQYVFTKFMCRCVDAQNQSDTSATGTPRFLCCCCFAGMFVL